MIFFVQAIFENYQVPEKRDLKTGSSRSGVDPETEIRSQQPRPIFGRNKTGLEAGDETGFRKPEADAVVVVIVGVVIVGVGVAIASDDRQTDPKVSER